MSEPFVDFQYPDENSDQKAIDPDLKALEMLHRLLSFVLPAKNPRLQLTALAYTAGIDLSFFLNCENTETSIAKAIGETQQSFHRTVNEISLQYGIHHRSTGKPHDSRNTYRSSNVRRTKET